MNTREKILSKANALILSRGYNAFSFQDISGPLNIKNAAIHYHFSTKEALGIEVIQGEYEKFRQWRETVSTQTCRQQLESFFDIYDQKIKQHKICIVGSISTDYYTIPDSMRSEIHVLVVAINGYLTELLRSGIRHGVFHFIGNPEDKAGSIIANLAAGIQIARVLGNLHFEKIKSQIRLELNNNNYG